MAADIDAASAAAGDVHRLRRELRTAGPGEREAIKLELEAAQRRYFDNPVEVTILLVPDDSAPDDPAA